MERREKLRLKVMLKEIVECLPHVGNDAQCKALLVASETFLSDMKKQEEADEKLILKLEGSGMDALLGSGFFFFPFFFFFFSSLPLLTLEQAPRSAALKSRAPLHRSRGASEGVGDDDDDVHVVEQPSTAVKRSSTKNPRAPRPLLLLLSVIRSRQTGVAKRCLFFFLFSCSNERKPVSRYR